MNTTTSSTNTNSTVNSTVDSSMNSRPTPRLTGTVSRVRALSTPVTHQIYAGLRWCLPGRGRTLATTSDFTADGRRLSGDRGAVSLEQVLWFVASGVSVAVVAGVLWGRIREQAETPIQPPSAP
jgi:hypothetical protein